jgi:hypothetical protein
MGRFGWQRSAGLRSQESLIRRRAGVGGGVMASQRRLHLPDIRGERGDVCSRGKKQTWRALGQNDAINPEPTSGRENDSWNK